MNVQRLDREYTPCLNIGKSRFFFISINDHQKECLFPFLGEDPSLSSHMTQR